MAYWIQKTPDNHNMSGYKLYRCDYKSDIADLPRFGIYGKPQKDDSTASSPCSYGSECECIEEGGLKYTLGKDTNAWKPLNNIGNSSDSGSGGSSSSGGTDLNIATDDDVDNVLDSVFGDK